jgi:ABC-type glycerol-3-phosphate transport system permease component
VALYNKNINPRKFHKSQLKIYAYVIPLALFMLMPIVFIFSHALKPMDELFAFPPRFFVTRPTLENFRNLVAASRISSIPVSRYVFNSLVVTLSVVTFSVLFSSMAGFALSKMRFRGSKAIFEINRAALMFVPVAVMIPRYLTITAIGIKDTYMAHILPLLAMPIGLFLIKQFIDQIIPMELIEAGYIDGANDFKIYTKIILPLIKPALATTAILSFQAVWGNIETSAMFVTSEGMRTLPFYMGTMTSTANIVAGQGMQAAATLIMFLPNLILFIILQSNVMNTVAHSGMK